MGIFYIGFSFLGFKFVGGKRRTLCELIVVLTGAYGVKAADLAGMEWTRRPEKVQFHVNIKLGIAPSPSFHLGNIYKKKRLPCDTLTARLRIRIR